MPRRHIHKEGRDADQDGRDRPQHVEHDRVDARLDHPAHLVLSRGHRALDPATLPGKELDEFDLGVESALVPATQERSVEASEGH